MIGFQPWDDHGGMAVFRQLDPSDWTEAALVRGGQNVTHLGLFADWRTIQPACIISQVLTWWYQPFAVLAVSNTGQAGVAQAAFLACNHASHRRPLQLAGSIIRHRLPVWMHERGIHRIEARAWAGHPTAQTFLLALGFRFEARMFGFGADGQAEFRQFAYVTQPPNPERT